MALTNFKKSLVTPIGIASYPHLNMPDTKFGAGAFKTGLRMSGIEGQEFYDKLKAIAAEALTYQQQIDKDYAKIKELKIPMALAKDADGNDIEGTYEFRCKTNASFTDKRTNITTANKLLMVDAQKNPTTVIVGSGSKLRAKITLVPYTIQGGGLSARINVVQILELAAGGESLSDFDTVEDGFSAPAETATVASVAVAEEEGQDDF